MATVQTASKIFEEISQLFASSPSDADILKFHPSADVVLRASELLTLNTEGPLDAEIRNELNQYEHAELLMRLVKAQVRARQTGL